MKISSTLFLLSALFLVSCNGVEDTSPEPKTPEPITVQAETENSVAPVSGNEVSEQTPTDTLKLDSQTKTETNLGNF